MENVEPKICIHTPILLGQFIRYTVMLVKKQRHLTLASIDC